MEDALLKIPCGKYIPIKRQNRKEPHPYPGVTPTEVTAKKMCGKWYALAVYEIEVEVPPPKGVEVGIDVNVGQSVAVFTKWKESDYLTFRTMNEKENKRRKIFAERRIA